MSENKQRFSNNLIIILTFVGIVLGCVVGLVWKDAGKLEPLGTLYINLMLCVAVPLIFFSISSTIGNKARSSNSGKAVAFSILAFYVSTSIAIIMMISSSLVFPLSNINIQPEASEGTSTALDVPSMLVNFLSQSDFISLFSTKAILPLMTAAVLFGFAIRKCGGAESPVGKFFANMNDCLTKTIAIVNYYMPIGIFGFMATLVAKYGSGFVKGYIQILLLAVCTMAVYYVIFVPLYVLWAAGVDGFKIMLRHIGKIIPVAFGTRSSVATIPTNLEQADDSGIPRDISSIVIPLGATMNMNGTAIAHAGKVLFISAFLGTNLTFVNYLMIVLLISFISFATPGIPNGSKAGVAMICSLFFPDNFGIAITICSAIASICDPFSTTVNASMDYIMSFVVTRCVEGKGWLKKAKAEEQ